MKTIIFVASTLVIVTMLTLTGCSKHKEPSESSESKPKPAVTEQKPPPPPGVNVFNSFDAHNKFDKKAAWAVMNDSQAGYRGQAEWFIPTGSGQLNIVDLAMMGKGTINVTVAEDKNGLPGNPLESFLNVPSSNFGKGGHLVLVSETHPALNAGIKYWLCVEPASSDTVVPGVTTIKIWRKDLPWSADREAGHFFKAALATGPSVSTLSREKKFPLPKNHESFPPLYLSGLRPYRLRPATRGWQRCPDFCRTVAE